MEDTINKLMENSEFEDWIREIARDEAEKMIEKKKDTTPPTGTRASGELEKPY